MFSKFGRPWQTNRLKRKEQYSSKVTGQIAPQRKKLTTINILKECKNKTSTDLTEFDDKPHGTLIADVIEKLQ